MNLEGPLTRREIFRTVALMGGGLLLSVLGGSGVCHPDTGLRLPPGTTEGMRSSPARMVGEELWYEGGSSRLPKMAIGRIELKHIRDTDLYMATFATQLIGALDLLSLHRRDLFISLMEWSQEEGRFMSRWYAEQAMRLGRWRRKVLIFGPDGNNYREHSIHPHRSKIRRIKIPQAHRLDDPLCSFYNFRCGVYGDLRPGNRYVIPTVSKRRLLFIRLKVATQKESDDLRPRSRMDGLHLVRAHLDREILDSIKGDVEAWLNGEWIPVLGRAKEVKLLGEVRALLLRRGTLKEPFLEAPPQPPLQRIPLQNPRLL